MQVFQTIVQLKTTAGGADKLARVLGYATAGDGGGGDFYWDSTSLDPDNSGTIFSLTTGGTGRWKRLYSEAINVKWFGAQGNGSGDDTTAIQRALDFTGSRDGGKVYIPKGIFMINAHEPVVTDPLATYNPYGGGLSIPSDTHLEIDHDATLQVIGNSEPRYNLIRLLMVDNVIIEGGNLVGDRHTHSGIGGEWGYGIGIYGSSNVTIRDMHIRDMWGDGIDTQMIVTGSGAAKVYHHCQHILIDNVVSDNNLRQGLSIESGIHVAVRNSVFSNTHGTAPQAGIDIEPIVPEAIVKEVSITNCSFLQNSGVSLQLVLNPDNNKSIAGVLVRDCYFNGNDTGSVMTLGPVTDVTIDHCTFDETDSVRAVGLYGGDRITVSNTTFVNCHFNIGDMNYPDITGNCVVDSCRFIVNKQTANLMGGVIVGNSGRSKDLIVRNCYFNGACEGIAQKMDIYVLGGRFTFTDNVLENVRIRSNLRFGGADNYIARNTFRKLVAPNTDYALSFDGRISFVHNRLQAVSYNLESSYALISYADQFGHIAPYSVITDNVIEETADGITVANKMVCVAYGPQGTNLDKVRITDNKIISAGGGLITWALPDDIPSYYLKRTNFVPFTGRLMKTGTGAGLLPLSALSGDQFWNADTNRIYECLTPAAFNTSGTVTTPSGFRSWTVS